MDAHLNTILATLPQFIGESFDEAAWRDCLTLLFQRIAAAQPPPPPPQPPQN